MRDRMLLGVFVSVVFLVMGRFATAADENAPSAIQAFCIDFNWGPKGINALALAEDHLPSPDYHPQPSDPAWLSQVVQLHGHLGPSVVAGARMGMIGRDAVGAKGYFDVEVTCEGPLAQPPQSCFLDGIQAATGATTGKRTLNWVQADQIAVRIRNTRTGEAAEIRPTPALMELLGSFKTQPKAAQEHGPGQQDHERLEAVARKIAAMPEKEIATVTTVAGKELPRSITLTVASHPGQTLEGFGCSMVDLTKSKIPGPARAEMFDQVFGGLHMNLLRLWAEADANHTVARMKADFYRTYVDSGVIADAKKRGVTTLLLAPARGEKPPTEPISEYARKLAVFIQGVKAERGIRINVTGIANEPDGFKPAQMAEAVRVLRRELDARSLQDVQIIAPEWANADSWALRCIAGIKADPEAWAALRGIATHSYSMAATPEFPKIISGTDKQYWMTEASDNGNESEDDVNLAASIGARFLNDLNHGVTHWVYFIGFYDSPDVATDRDNATKFMVYDYKQRRIVRHLKYDWFRQLRAAFPNGSRIYPLKAQPGGDLVFTYGQKPYLNAAFARRPDGGWSLGAINLSGVKPNTSISQWHPATALKVTWRATPLAGDETTTFNIFRSDVTRRFVSVGEATMTKGSLTLVLQPGELVTLIGK